MTTALGSKTVIVGALAIALLGSPFTRLANAQGTRRAEASEVGKGFTHHCVRAVHFTQYRDRR